MDREGGDTVKPYYDHAGITIYCGDARAVLPEIAAVNLVLTVDSEIANNVDGYNIAGSNGLGGGVRFRESFRNDEDAP